MSRSSCGGLDSEIIIMLQHTADGVVGRRGQEIPSVALRLPRRVRHSFAAAAALLLVTALAGADDFTRDDLEFLIRQSTPHQEVLAIIDESPTIRLTDADLDRLRNAGADRSLIDAIHERMRENPIGVLIAMKEQEADEGALLDWILRWVMPISLDTRQRLQLRRAGIDDSIQSALEGQYAPAGFREYRDPFGFVSVHYPAAWIAHEFFGQDGFVAILTPDRDVSEQDDFTTGVQLQFRAVNREAALEFRDLRTWMERHQATWLSVNAKFDPEVIDTPEVTARDVKLRGVPGLILPVHLTMRSTRCRSDVLTMHQDGSHYYIEFVAPAETFDEHRTAFEEVRRSIVVRPNEKRLLRRRIPIPPAELLQQARESVVQVRSHFANGAGHGSGFFVRADGLILTNHHVICAKESHHDCTGFDVMELPQAIDILWDAAVGPKRTGETHRTERVELVDTVYQVSPRMDFALLRAPRRSGGYKALPILPIDSGQVRIGNPVVAIGFPVPGRMGVGNLFQTEGTVSNITYVETRSGLSGPRPLDTLYITAEINPGNSGGPCVDLMTGAVIGLNTYIPLAGGQRLNYGGLSVIDHVFDVFPQIRWHRADRPLTASEHLELGRMFLYADLDRPAMRELLLAFNQRTHLDEQQSALLTAALAMAFTRENDHETAEHFCRIALDERDDLVDVLSTCILVAVNRRQLDEALLLADRFIEEHPTSTAAYSWRSSIYQRSARFDDALSDIDKAIQLSDGQISDFHFSRAYVLKAMDRLADAEAAFRRAVTLNSSNPGPVFALIEMAAARGETNRARQEIRRELAARADSPEAHRLAARLYANHLNLPEEAMEAYATAILLDVNYGRTPGSSDLYAICVLARDRDPDQLLAAARLWLHYYPTEEAIVHTWLASYWESVGFPEVAGLHYAVNEENVGRRTGAALRPLTFEAVEALVDADFDAGLFGDLMSHAALAFQLNESHLAEIRKFVQSGRWTPIHVLFVAMQSVQGQVVPSESLAAALTFEFAATSLTSTNTDVRGPYRFTNSARLPLTGIVLKHSFLDDNGRVLCEIEKEHHFLLGPKSTETHRIVYPTWNEVRARGVDPNAVTRFSVALVAARDGSVVHEASVSGTKRPRDVEVTVRNGSRSYSLANPVVAATFVNRNGPVFNADGVSRLTDKLMILDTVAPGKQIVEHIEQWINMEYLHSIGLPRDPSAYASFSVVGGTAVMDPDALHTYLAEVLAVCIQ